MMMTPIYDELAEKYDYDTICGWAFEDYDGLVSQAWEKLCIALGDWDTTMERLVEDLRRVCRKEGEL